MRDRDRFWWARLISGLAFCAAGVIGPYFVVNAIPWGGPFMTATQYALMLAVAGLLALACLGGGVALSSVPARGRHVRRLAALRGDASAMPPAAIHPDPSGAPDVADQSLELTWRESVGTQFVNWLLIATLVVVPLPSAGFSFFEIVAPVFWPSRPISLIEAILRIAGISVFAALLIGLLILLVRVLPLLFGRPFGITASASGVDERTQLGTRVFLAWNEIRLLEVTKGSAQWKRAFVLYAPGKSINWTEYVSSIGGSPFVPVGATASEMTLRQAALLDLIAAQTGLTPRTFDKAMQREPGSVPAAKREASRSSGAIALLVVALIIPGFAAAEGFFPVTPYGWLNWASAGSLGLAALLTFIASVWTALTTRPLPAHAAPPSAGAPSLEAPGVTYTFTWRTPGLRRLWFILVGLILVVNLASGAYLLLWMFYLQITFIVPSLHPQLTGDPFPGIGQFFLAFFLIGFGMMGLALVYAGTIAATAQIQATKDGLSLVGGRRERLIPWPGVLDISWGRGAGGQTAYLVKSDVPTVQISWPAGIQTASELPPRDGALPIGPDELAALVAARTGKPISVRR